MGSKAIIFVGFFLAIVLLISSEVAARELAETSKAVDASKEAEKTNGAAVDDVKYPGGGYGGPGGGYGGPGGGRGGYPGRGGYNGRRGGYCRYGCCGRRYYGGGCRCCTYAGEKADAEALAKPQH
ncbi:Glycine-rich protein [Sesamum alatum]|uniref:Glycine-rich protein n=1 Tax=Sesamum alatum TaxID=300844 RepID=A0AAE1XXS9_9LAMI|nr:Glycine-rich protein [Sesamum alatum]